MNLRRTPHTLAAALLLMALGVNIFGQVGSRIMGGVRDSSGAHIVGVKVTLTDVNRGSSQTATTNEAGRFAFTNLDIGEYVIGAEMSGFKRATTTKIRLEVNQAIEQELTLEVGQVTERVEVTGSATLLQTNDSQVGGVIENKQIRDLPLVARDFSQLALLVPGVVEVRTGSALRRQTERGTTWAGAYSVHGMASNYNGFIFDGVDGREQQSGSNIFSPSVDAIAEMKVQTSNYNAEFGEQAGGQISVVTKGGTNAIHGSAQEFLRNDAMDARAKYAARRPQLNRNTFGATIGGPIRRDRTFYFGSWEATRLRQGATSDTTVPTAAFRSGDFSSLLRTDNSNRTPIVLYDWTTGMPFAGNIIPQNRINPLTANILRELVPLPNQAGSGGIRPISNFQSLNPAKVRSDQYLTRIDHVFSSNHRLYGRYAYSNHDNERPVIWPAYSYNQMNRGQHAILNWNSTVGANKVFDFRGGYSRFNQTNINESQFKRNIAAELGLRGACENQSCWHVPDFQVQDFTGFGHPYSPEAPRGFKSEIYQLHTSLMMLKGNHTLKLGFTANRHKDTFPNGGLPAGQHTFNGQWTAGAGSPGFGLADAMLGLPRTIQAIVELIDPNFRNSHLAPWIQDDWKVTRRLTLNFGLRYEWMGVPYANRDRISNFMRTSPSTGIIITPQDTGSNTPLIQKKPDSLGRSLMMNDNNNFGPRIGFAFQAMPKTVIRGAYGIFYQRDTTNDWITMGFNLPFNRQGFVTLQPTQQDFARYPVNDLGPVVNYGTPGAETTISAHNIDWTLGKIQQWNLYVERSLAADFVFKVGYVGNKGVGIPRAYSLNEPIPGPGSIGSRRPMPSLGYVWSRTSDGQAGYNGLEVEAEKRFSKGISFVGSYTWSRALDNQTVLDLWFGGNNKGLSALNISQRFSFGGTWEVPIGKGRRFATNLSGVTNGILGGWEMSGMLVLRTGFPLNLTTNGNVANAELLTMVPNRIGQGNLPRSEQTLERFFDTSAFVRPPNFTLGNAGPFPIYGPGFRNLDMAIHKTFRPLERLLLQVRAESFNLANHPNNGQPGGTHGSAAFGRITATFGDPRIMQLGMKILF